MKLENIDKIANTLQQVDAITGMKKIPDKSIDLIFCDLPFGTTQNAWDVVIPMEEMWSEYNRIIKDRGIIVLFGMGTFSAKLMLSNEKYFRYSNIYMKKASSGFLNAKRMPLRAHEDILVFYKKAGTYNPQKTKGHSPVHTYKKQNNADGENYGITKSFSGGGSTERYPTTLWGPYSSDKQKSSFSPTQKPIKLCRDIIKTYSNKGDLVLDNCCGSGSGILASLIEKRNFIGFDKYKSNVKNSIFYGVPWVDITKMRIEIYKESGIII